MKTLVIIILLTSLIVLIHSLIKGNKIVSDYPLFLVYITYLGLLIIVVFICFLFICYLP
jgi:hypothetical protein